MKLKNIYGETSDVENEFLSDLKNNVFIRVCDSNNYEAAYDDFKSFEEGFSEGCKVNLSYEEFVNEVKKGYNAGQTIQVARLLCLSTGIYYDNEFTC